jgi:hypothetical protein
VLKFVDFLGVARDDSVGDRADEADAFVDFAGVFHELGEG